MNDSDRPGVRLAVALVHHPVVDKNGELITSALTPTDLHDVARSARTYGVSRYYIVTPLKDQQKLARRMLGFWQTGVGAGYNPNRGQALDLIRIVPQVEDAAADLTERDGQRPQLWATTAGKAESKLSFSAAREMVAAGRSALLLFGTAWGLAPAALEKCDYTLASLTGPTDYNHLSVRSAAAVILDRLLGRREEN